MQVESEKRYDPSAAKGGYSREGLAALDDQRLNSRHRRMLQLACQTAGGSPVWVRRKTAEARDLLALSELAPQRLHVDSLSLGEELKAICRVRVRVATRGSNDQEVEIAERALLGLSYPRQALLEPQPGYAFFSILEPDGVWHAQVSRFPVQRLCLGDTLPAGIRIKELVLMAYYALSMQAFQINAADPAGVLNMEAAQWWQRNVERIPLSRAPFLSDPEFDAEVAT